MCSRPTCVVRLSRLYKKQIFTLVSTILFLVCICCALYLDFEIPADIGKTLNNDFQAPTSRNQLIILSWRRPWGQNWKGHPEGQSVGNCILTYDRSRIRDAAAVVFHYTALDDEPIPWTHYRKPSQYFVFWADKGPAYIRNSENRHPNKFNRAFINWTMSYRLNSDIFYPYLGMKMAQVIFSRGKDFVDSIMPRKKRLGIWFVKDCNFLRGSRLRMKLVNQLTEAGLKLDLYGWCYGNQNAYKKLSQDVLDSYKFYLAFENSEHCIDYLTSEFWEQAIYKGRVPVVWGPSKKTVMRLAPPGSFIHAEDFESPAKLAAHLMYLDTNEEAYRKYFKWMEKPDSETIRISQLYTLTAEHLLCNKLQNKPRRKVTGDISYFHFGVDWETCIDLE